MVMVLSVPAGERVQVMDEVEMRTWHPACSGFVMRKDDTAEDLYAEYQLGDLFRCVRTVGAPSSLVVTDDRGKKRGGKGQQG